MPSILLSLHRHLTHERFCSSHICSVFAGSLLLRRHTVHLLRLGPPRRCVGARLEKRLHGLRHAVHVSDLPSPLAHSFHRTLANSLIVGSIQYFRHLHDKVKAIDERTAPPKEDTAAAEAAAAAAAVYGGFGGGGFMMNDTLMIANSAYCECWTVGGGKKLFRFD